MTSREQHLPALGATKGRSLAKVVVAGSNPVVRPKEHAGQAICSPQRDASWRSPSCGTPAVVLVARVTSASMRITDGSRRPPSTSAHATSRHRVVTPSSASWASATRFSGSLGRVHLRRHIIGFCGPTTLRQNGFA